MSEYSQSALAILRKPWLTMQWYAVPLFVILLYIIINEFSKKNYNVLLGAAALWGMDLFNELWNSMVFFGTGRAPVWGTPGSVGNTSFLILIGYNLEISIMFAILGIVACKQLIADPKKKVLGINNRVLAAIVMTTLAVAIECFLNYTGVLTWEYPWWSRKVPYLIWLIGYLPFYTMAFIVHDMKKRKNQFITLGIIFGVDLLLIIVLACVGWI
jgi:hypothetical protein